jgi:hypothetical protein
MRASLSFFPSNVVRQVDAPKAVLGFQRFDAGLELIRGELLSPFNPKLSFFRPTLQTDDHSWLQLCSEGAKSCP